MTVLCLLVHLVLLVLICSERYKISYYVHMALAVQ